MTEARLPRINQQVHMKPEGRERWETTVVQDFQDNLMAVATPAPYLGAGDVVPGQRWIVRYCDQWREYRFTATVHAVEYRPVALTWLELPALIEEVQRREHVRLAVRLPARIWAHDDVNPQADAEAHDHRQPGGAGGDAGPAEAGAGDPGVEAVTVDISGGGALLRPVGGPLPEARSYTLSIQLPDGPVVTRARLVRCTEQRLPDGRLRRTYAFAFEGIHMAEQDRIVRFIFAEQQRLRRHGLA